MDKPLTELFEELKKRVEIYDGEQPLTRVQDAIRVAQRNGLIYRYAQNGATWEIRWTVDHPVVLIAETNLCESICRHIITNIPVRALLPPAEVVEKAPAKPVAKGKRIAAPKKRG